jgi:hypothetical protein
MATPASLFATTKEWNPAEQWLAQLLTRPVAEASGFEIRIDAYASLAPSASLSVEARL